MNNTWTSQVIDTIVGMFDEEQNNISVKDILAEHYRCREKPTPRTVSVIQAHLRTFRKILHDVRYYDVCIIGKQYYTQRHRGINNIEQGKMCLPTCAKENRAWGLHLRTEGNDWIWMADVIRNNTVAAGARKNAVNRVVEAYNNGDIGLSTAEYLIQVDDKYEPKRLINHKMLETSKVNVSKVNAVQKWLPTE
jgi:hypothetical protein